MQQLSQQDAGFLYSETPRVPMHICSLHVYDPSTAPGGQVTFDAILGQVRHRLPLARVLRRKLVRVPFDFDYPYWVEDRNFDLEFHVRNIALPAPGDWRQLWVQAARLHSYPLDLSRPPWELYVIEGLDNAGDFPEGSFGIFIKVHHSAIDGVSGIELMNALHDLSPDGRAPTLDTWRGEDDPAPWETLARAGQKIAFAPARFLQLLTTTMPALRSAPLAEPERTSPPRLPTTPLNRQATTNRVGDAFRFDLELAKRIRSAVSGATVNDVVLTVVGGGLRAYLDSKGELPTTPLHAGVPISLRTDDEKGQGGNRISLMIVSLGTDQAGALDRLKAVRESTSQSKEANAGVGARALAEASELFPGALLGLAVRGVAAVGRRRRYLGDGERLRDQRARFAGAALPMRCPDGLLLRPRTGLRLRRSHPPGRQLPREDPSRGHQLPRAHPGYPVLCPVPAEVLGGARQGHEDQEATGSDEPTEQRPIQAQAG